MTARRMREAAAQEAYRSAGRFDTPDRIRSLPLPTPTDADVERVARAMCSAWCYAPEGTPDWNMKWRSEKSQLLTQARAAIQAYEEGGE